MEVATRKENWQLQKTTIPVVPKTEERKWYFFDVLLDRQEKEKILQYYLKNNINKITLQGDNLITEDDNHQSKTIPINNAETQQIKSYLRIRNQQILAKKDLREKGFGRIAVKIAEILRGKNRVDFIPNSDLGNFVVLTNVKHVFFSGDKLDKEKHRRHSGYPGGLKERTFREMLEKSPTKLVFQIIRGMVPHTKLGNKQLKRLRIYPTAEHEQQAQEKNFIEINI